MDEPTSGLDPIMREEILSIILDYVQDGKHSVLISSHITSDLEKIADYIVFIHNGKVIFNVAMQEILTNYGIGKCDAAQFDAINKENVLYCRRQGYEWDILIADRNNMQQEYPDVKFAPATIEDIMLFYIKGEQP